MVWPMEGSTMRPIFDSSVDDWLFTEDTEDETDEAEEEDCCISIVVLELITFSWATDVFVQEINSHQSIKI